MSVRIRPATPADAAACGQIIHEAFTAIAEQHGFPSEHPTLEGGIRVASLALGHPKMYGVVAEQDGQVVGSSFLHEQDAIRGVGPVTVAPQVQTKGVGRQLMEAMLQRAKGASGVRLVQEAYSTASLSLYASLGFEVREPLLLLRGMPRSQPPTSTAVRPLVAEDLPACTALCTAVLGSSRGNELQDALTRSTAMVAVREGRVTAYASAVTRTGHGVAETEADLAALLAGVGARSPEPLTFILPGRQAGLFRWCLQEGLRVIKPLMLMTRGTYQEPTGCYFPSIIY